MLLERLCGPGISITDEADGEARGREKDMLALCKVVVAI